MITGEQDRVQKSAEIQPRMITGEQNTLPRAITGAQESAQIQPTMITGEQDTRSLERWKALKSQQKSGRGWFPDNKTHCR